MSFPLHLFRATVLLLAVTLSAASSVQADESEVAILIPAESPLLGAVISLRAGPDEFTYGTTDAGEFFRLRGDGSELQTLARFRPDEGIIGGLVLANDGSFYGRAKLGQEDILYRIDREGKRSEIYRFNNGRGSVGLTKGRKGVLYGIVFYPGNRIFRINTDGTGFKVLHQFGENSGPSSSLIQDDKGTLYGTALGGANATGFVYALSEDGAKFEIITAFHSRPKRGHIELADPTDLVLADDGFLYGAATSDGTTKKSFGGIFRLRKNGANYETVRQFSSRPAPGKPETIRIGFDGQLYGSAVTGGHQRHGVFFSMQRNGQELTNLLEPDDIQPRSHWLSIVDEIEPLVFIGHSGGGQQPKSVVYRFKVGVPAPSISVRGSKATKEPNVRVAGTAKSRVGIRRVEYRVKAGAFRRIRTTENWSFAADLSPGQNQIEIRVTDSRGQESVKTITVSRK